VADLTVALRACPQDTWTAVGVDPDQVARAVVGGGWDGEGAGLQTVENRRCCLRRGGVMLDPMSDEERALLEHRWAVRVSLPGQASHAAQVARRLVDAAADARLDAPAVVVRAVEALEGYAVAVHERVQAERAELQRRGVDPATFQQDLERGTLSSPPEQAGP
jgi:hypothetical protein